jgi:hypothetical protein
VYLSTAAAEGIGSFIISIAFLSTEGNERDTPKFIARKEFRILTFLPDSSMVMLGSQSVAIYHHHHLKETTLTGMKGEDPKFMK